MKPIMQRIKCSDQSLYQLYNSYSPSCTTRNTPVVQLVMLQLYNSYNDSSEQKKRMVLTYARNVGKEKVSFLTNEQNDGDGICIR